MDSAAIDPCRVTFAALDPYSTTPATLGKGCRAAMARKSGRPGIYIGTVGGCTMEKASGYLPTVICDLCLTMLHCSSTSRMYDDAS